MEDTQDTDLLCVPERGSSTLSTLARFQQLSVGKENTTVLQGPVEVEHAEKEVDTVGDLVSEQLGAGENMAGPASLHDLPDLLWSGSPLRRRVSSPVCNTLKEVRREVELSRRRSLKLKAQVERLQGQDGPGWSQHKEQVTEEIRSILRLLLPLTDVDPNQADAQESPMDAVLSQLRNVARALALDHTKQAERTDGGSAVLQQALRDRDEALAKKSAMEAELLRSKTEMMSLNNQLLEAVQHRLELSLELEAWKEDVQLILQQQILSQQQEEQNQKKSSRFLTFKRGNKTPPKASPSQSPVPITPVAQRWREKLRRGRANQLGDIPSQADHRASQVAAGESGENTFQTISLE
ncbi:bicaudal-D-related protein 2-like [Denticeps clupeoides]|uniref:BICD family-like cargo adapter 1 n=1 Tax=Denticeps clupeoides TaxID=299321 RepID=A0AAY4BR56_9TELE|nr:uncharacterized protein LOC114793184 [Denticeps clupeoides]